MVTKSAEPTKIPQEETFLVQARAFLSLFDGINSNFYLYRKEKEKKRELALQKGQKFGV